MLDKNIIDDYRDNEEYIYISRSLDIDYIEDNLINSSSKIFEHGLIEALKKERKVSILYLGDIKIAKKNFNSINYRSILGAFNLLFFLYSRRKSKANIITSGYNLNLNIILIFSRLLGYQVFTYVYDTHLVATESMNIIKKLIVDSYFSTGFKLLKYFNGVLVLNDNFIRDNKRISSYHKTKIGYSQIKNSEEFRKNNIIKVIFAGTLNSENGIDVIIECLKIYKNEKIEFLFYGNGNKLNDLKKYQDVDKRVMYCGVLPIDKLQERFKSVDYLINLRDPNSISCKFSFPSKLIQFMGSGTPVISNTFPGLDKHYSDYFIRIDNFTALSLKKVLSNLPSEERKLKIGKESERFIVTNNDWKDIAKRLLSYIESNDKQSN